MPKQKLITAGFSQTADCAILAVAVKKAFAADEGVELQLLRRRSSDAVLADLKTGNVQVAHLPAPFPVASALDLADFPPGLVAPFVLALGGATFTVSTILYNALLSHGLKTPDPATLVLAFARYISWRRAHEQRPLRIAVEHRHSAGWYELRYLLGVCRIPIPSGIEMIVADPPDMPHLLATEDIDGFYAGEPYGSLAVRSGKAHITTSKSRVWQNAPEKILAVQRPWADENPLLLDALLRALYRSGEWCANPRNIEELAGILAAPQYLAVGGDMILPVLTGFVEVSGVQTMQFAEFFSTSNKAANFPWQSQALWFFNQMLRWHDCPGAASDNAIVCEAVRDSYRPDIYRQAVKPLFVPVPGANLKMEGTLLRPMHVGASRSGLVLGPDAFFDRRIFDPERFTLYDDG